MGRLNLKTAYQAIKLNAHVEKWVRLYRSQLAELFEGEKCPNLHFFCPYQDAAQSLAKHLRQAGKN